MATKKKMLQAAAGNAGGAGGVLNVEDVFSTYLYDGTSRSNPIENGIKLGQSFGSGSARFDGVVSDYLISSSAVTLSGDFTVEAWVWFEYYFSGQNQILGSDFGGTGGVNNQVYIQNADRYLGFYDGSSAFLSSTQVPNSAWSHIAITRSGSSCKFYINGNASGTFTSSASVQFQAVGSLPGAGEFFEGYMNDVRIVDGTVVYTGNFTPPTAPLTAITNTELLVCQGADPFVDNSANGYTITNNGNVSASTFGPFDAAEAGEGGLVWVKSRSHSTAHILNDTERGANSFLSTNDTDAAGGSSTVNSFNANGFTVGSSGDINEGGGYTYASWTFRKAPKFFDVVTWTGDGSTSRQISHNLGSVPGCIIIKRTDAAAGWPVFHRSLGHVDGTPNLLFLHATNAAGSSTLWDNTAPTSSTFNIDDSSTANASGGTYVAYLFAHNDGDGEFGPNADQDIIKCGSYTGNGSIDGPEIDLGFEPQWFIHKRIDSGDGWPINDVMRGLDYSTVKTLRANSIGAEGNSGAIAHPTATGIKLTTSDAEWNGSGGTYIYIAIRRGTKVPESAAEVFAPVITGQTNDPQSGFPTDLWWLKARNGPELHIIMDRMRGTQAYLSSDSTAAEGSNPLYYYNIDNMTGGFSNGGSYSQYVHWMWKRAPGFLDAVAYTGNGTTRNVSHNLGVAPEMMIVKSRGSGGTGWMYYHKDAGNTKALWVDSSVFNPPEFHTDSGWWANTTPSDTSFRLGINTNVNASNFTYIAYLFASLDGVSKVGSYTGTGNNVDVDCGFSSGARFVLIFREDSASDIYVYDSERGIVSGVDPFLLLNKTDAEDAGNDGIDPLSSGFTVTSSSGLNTSGGTYLFYAIA